MEIALIKRKNDALLKKPQKPRKATKAKNPALNETFIFIVIYIV
tara:strand:+ start:467 stop:598 length:132 start_codon:yes stop_codon:yes gene_type:complete